MLTDWLQPLGVPFPAGGRSSSWALGLALLAVPHGLYPTGCAAHPGVRQGLWHVRMGSLSPEGGQWWDPGWGAVWQRENPWQRVAPGLPCWDPSRSWGWAVGRVGASCTLSSPCRPGTGPAGTGPADHPESTCGNQYKPKFPRQHGRRGSSQPCSRGCPAAASPKGQAGTACRRGVGGHGGSGSRYSRVLGAAQGNGEHSLAP